MPAYWSIAFGIRTHEMDITNQMTRSSVRLEFAAATGGQIFRYFSN